jgi:hypothetical protein
METHRKICKEHINSSTKPQIAACNLSSLKNFFAKNLPFLWIAWLILGTLILGSTHVSASLWDSEKAVVPSLIDHPLMPLTTLVPGDERPVYRQTYDGQNLRFVVLKTKLALVVSSAVFTQARSDAGIHQKYVEQFPPDLLKIWFDDAMHWLLWLEGWDDAFFSQ